MDLAPETEPIDLSEAKLGILSEKRPIDGGGDAKLGEKRSIDSVGDGQLKVDLNKKARCEEMKRVAEIVMVLSAMAEMRGGRTPTAAEVEMMAEARAKAAALCQSLAPKDLVEKEAIGVVIEDLGLNCKAKELKLGFRPPKMSIAEKLLLSKRRLEESKEFATHSGTYSSNRLQTGIGAATEVRGSTHSNSGLPSDKANNMPISSQLGSSTSIPYQYPTNEVRPSMVSSGLPGSHIVKNSSPLVMPRVERANFRLDARARQVQDSSADRGLVNAPAWSLQPQSTLAAKSGPENKVFKVDGTQSRVAPQTTRDQTPRPILSHTTSVNMLAQQPLQAPLLSKNHSEIGKIVHKLLQPRLPEHPTWTPPSRDYMNKALNCQICQITINEVDNVLLCDACEKGFHLKCLQAYNQKGIPRVEWHCPKCLTLSNGKPLPPKYGRVMRNMNPLKAAPKISAAQSISEKKVGNLDQKVNMQTIPANGSSTFQSSASVESGSVVNNPNSREMQENNIPSSTNMNEKVMEADCSSPVVSASGKSVQEVQNFKSSSCESEPRSVSKSVSPAKLADTVTNVSDSLASSKLQDNQTGELESAEKPMNKLHNNNNMDNDPDNKETINSALRCDIKSNNPEVTLAGLNETSRVSSGTTEGAGVSVNVELSVDWIGDALNIVDEKTFYSSCRINGVSYKVKDHALFHYSNDKLVPSKLKAMWEDSKTGSSWVIVNSCYFPEDLPEAVSRPSTPEINEVYESNNDSTVMTSLIRGSCKVLPPEKYKEESENTLLGTEASDDGTPPVFVCRWLYDESKAIFQPAST